jgi:methionyl-tRNA formyltransferase
MINTIFFGTPEFVTPICDALLDIAEISISGVVSAPDKPVGRKQIMTASPVKLWTQNHDIPAFTISDYPFSIIKADIGILAAYGQIIPQEIIDLFPKGILVIHPSLLPKYRGASPIQSAILNGDQKTGCSIIKMDAKMDHGPIVYQFEEEIKQEDTSVDLYNRIFTKTAEILKTVIPNYLKGKIIPQEQNEDEATYCKVLTKQDGFFDLDNPPSAEKLDRMIRAYSPWPGVWTLYQGKRIKFLPNNMVLLEGNNPVNIKQFEEANPDFKLY